MPGFLVAPLNALLGIRAGSKVSVINPPRGFVQLLSRLGNNFPMNVIINAECSTFGPAGGRTCDL